MTSLLHVLDVCSHIVDQPIIIQCIARSGSPPRW